MDPTSETLAAAFPDGSRVRAVQVAVLRNFPFALSGSVIVACFSAYALWHRAGPRVGAMDRCDAAGGRPALRRHAGLRSPSGAAGRGRTLAAPDVPGQSRLGHAVGPPIAYWSFFLPVEYQLFCIVILIGLGTGAIYSNYIVLPVVYAFEIPALAPPFIALAAQRFAAAHRHGGERSRLCGLHAGVHAPHASHAPGRPAAGLREQRCWSRCGARKRRPSAATWKNRASWPPPAMTSPARARAVSLFLGLLTSETHRAWPLRGGQHRQRDGGDGASVRCLAQYLQAGRWRDRAPAQVVPAQSRCWSSCGPVCAAGGAERLVAAGQASRRW